jgi:hypothetical protein
MTSPFTIAAAGTGKGVGVGNDEGVGLSIGLIAAVGITSGVAVSFTLEPHPVAINATPIMIIRAFRVILPLINIRLL